MYTRGICHKTRIFCWFMNIFCKFSFFCGSRDTLTLRIRIYKNEKLGFMQVETHFVPTILTYFGIWKYTLAVRKPTFKFDENFTFQNVVTRYCFKKKLSQSAKSLIFTCFLNPIPQQRWGIVAPDLAIIEVVSFTLDYGS